MENGNDLSSSLSFASSSNLSNGSTSLDGPYVPGLENGTNPELLSLSRLSSSLEKLVIGGEYDYSDAEVEVDGISVGIHRCVLAARSPFFHNLFKIPKEGEGKPKYVLSEVLPHGRIGIEAFTVVLHYLYTGRIKPSPPEVSTCVDESCAHDSCGPAINYAVEMMYASTVFQIQELVMVVQRRLLNYVDKAFVEEVIPILMVAFHSELEQLLSYCIHRISRSDLDDITIEKELPHSVSTEIKSLRLKSGSPEPVDSVHEKRIRNIHRALDSDDVELVKLLLEESKISLNGAYALHYAAAYCNPKIVDEVLDLDSNADVNLRNSRGYTVLHVAARRKDLAVVMRLLEHGARVADPTLDGRTAVTIRRRLTCPRDFQEAKQGEVANNDRLCVDVLEREMLRNPLAGDVSVSAIMVADDLHMRLLLLENRVAMARSLFPKEARLAMQMAHADSTTEFFGLSASKGSYGNFREVDLNEIPSEQVKKLQQRLQALQKTVETGRRFFPNCSEVLDKLLEYDTLGDLLLEMGSQEEQRMKRTRFMEIKKEVMMNAFCKDVAENNWPGFSTSSSSTSSPKGSLKRRAKRR